MILPKRLKPYKYDLLKILGVVFAVFLGLTINVKTIWETDQVVQFDYLDFFQEKQSTKVEKEKSIKVEQEELGSSLSEDEVFLDEDEIIEEEHSASASFSSLCTTYENLCKKVTFNGQFEDGEKYSYFDTFQYIISGIDTNAKRGEYLEKVLLQYLINQAKAERRGSAGWSKITINLWGMKYDGEYFQVLTHELGHIMDLGALQGMSRAKNVRFTEFDKVVFAIDDPSLEYYRYSRTSEKIRRSWVTKRDFCSGYGMSDPFEDFAECHNLYLNHNDLFQFFAKRNTNMKSKYNFFANLYGGYSMMNSQINPAEASSVWRAWDTTRIQE